MSAATGFTANQIAAALGRTGRAIRLELKTIPASGEVSLRGGRLPTWKLSQLPRRLVIELQTVATAGGYRDMSAMLTEPPSIWQPRHARVAARYEEKAVKLREAFRGTLRRLNDLTVSEAEFRARGRAEFRAVFGYEISEKQWQRILDRTVSRDRCAEEWERLAIYFDENCASAEPVIATGSLNEASEHCELKARVESFKDRERPSESETLLLWDKTFEHFHEMLAAGRTIKDARRSLLDFLHSHVPMLAKNRHALHVAFNHKLKLWEIGGRKPSVLRDQRAVANAERRAPELPDDDRQTILAYALKFRGLAPGWRKALTDGVLSGELSARHIHNPASKSDVPRAIQRALSNDLGLLDDAMHGPRCEKLNGPHIDRDPTASFSADWWQGDDCTLPNLYYEETAQGQRLMRGQFLAMIDVRSLYIVGFVLISAPQDRPSTYNAWHIRNLITTAHDTYGLPRRGFYFENGSWRAKVLTGSPHDWSESEMGLREFGLRFMHARLPRAKVIERVFASFQNLCQAEPGYVGRGWHNDRYERTEKQQSLVARGHRHASEHFLSRDEWMERLTVLVDRYNDEPQEGKYCRGPHGEKLSPRQAYEQFFGHEPAVKLPDEARYLLANERFPVTVGRNGIVIDRRRARGEEFTYKSEATGELWGRKVQVFFNLESPEIIGVKHPDTGEISAVRRSTTVPAMDPPAELLTQANRENSEHASYRRALYRAVVPKFSEHFLARPIFRPTLLDRATVEAGRNFTETAQVEKEAARRERKLQGRTVAAAKQIGLSVRGGRTSETRAAAAEELAQLLAEANEPQSKQ